MTMAFSGPLESRPNPSRWADLFDLALPALDFAMPHEQSFLARGSTPRWTLGGGTALALRLGHRTSDDIDVFLSGVRLAVLTPQQNPYAKSIGVHPDWPGHYLKFHRPDGEIDFLSSPLQTTPGFSVEEFRGQPVALETVEKVMVKKLRYRSANFTLRDTFNLLCVLQARPEAALTLAHEAGDTLSRVSLALQSLSDVKMRLAVRPTPAFHHILANPIDRARDGLTAVERLRDNPISPKASADLAKAVSSVAWFEPGSKIGRVHFGWKDRNEAWREAQLAAIDIDPVEGKAALLREWRARDPVAFDRWESHGRPATPQSQERDSRGGRERD